MQVAVLETGVISTTLINFSLTLFKLNYFLTVRNLVFFQLCGIYAPFQQYLYVCVGTCDRCVRERPLARAVPGNAASHR